MIDQEMFEPYLASGDEMRAIVEQCSGSLSALGSLFGQVTVEDRTALDATEGEIAAQLAIASEQVGHSHQRLEQSTVYAPGAVNLFADAIDRFNLTSESPRSVAKLNQARRQRTSAVLHGTSSGVGSDSDTALLLEFSRLYGQLDVEASQVGGMLTRGPNGDDLRAMFRTGAIPAGDVALFPGLVLTHDDCIDLDNFAMPGDLKTDLEVAQSIDV